RQVGDDVAPQVGRSRIAVQQDDWIADATLDVRHAATEDFLVLLERNGIGRHKPSYLDLEVRRGPYARRYSLGLRAVVCLNTRRNAAGSWYPASRRISSIGSPVVSSRRLPC